MVTKAILLVDDETMVLSSLKRSLRLRFGTVCRYETASSGEAGLERIRLLAAEGVQVVLVISDWLMPVMKGDEFLTRVRAQYPSVKLVMLTGHTDESEMAKLASDLQVAAIIRKPWDTADLFKVVAAALDQE